MCVKLQCMTRYGKKCRQTRLIRNRSGFGSHERKPYVCFLRLSRLHTTPSTWAWQQLHMIMPQRVLTLLISAVLDGIILATPKVDTYFINDSANEVKIRNSLLQLLLSLGQNLFWCVGVHASRSQWPRGLRRGYAAACLLGLWVRIPPGT